MPIHRNANKTERFVQICQPHYCWICCAAGAIDLKASNAGEGLHAREGRGTLSVCSSTTLGYGQGTQHSRDACLGGAACRREPEHRYTWSCRCSSQTMACRCKAAEARRRIKVAAQHAGGLAAQARHSRVIVVHLEMHLGDAGAQVGVALHSRHEGQLNRGRVDVELDDLRVAAAGVEGRQAG